MTAGPDPVSPRWRVPLLVLGFVSLATGIAGGLARGGWGIAPPAAIALHGALMVCGFFGTVISLERAVALGRPWAYAAPLASGAGGALLLAGATLAGLWLMALGAALLGAASIALFERQTSLETATLLGGALCWFVGNLLLALGEPVPLAVPWWIAFFALTIGGERLELSRYLPRAPAAKRGFAAIACAIALSALAAAIVPDPGGRAFGAVLVVLALWLYRFDIARATVRHEGLTRYIALCLLSGYAWLALGGAAIALATGEAAPLGGDAQLHALLVGFVFSMVFGHAPVILPAVLRIALPYSAWLYLPLALLHASLAVRVAGDLAALEAARAWGAAGNALAIAAFIATAALLALRRQRGASA